MKPRAKQEKPRLNHERWLVSYADFVTLLFAFFVVLYSVAQVDRKKIAELAEAIQQAFDGHESPISQITTTVQIPGALPRRVGLPTQRVASEADRDLTDLRKELEGALSEEIAHGEVAIRSSSEGLVISLREAGFFESGSAAMKENLQSVFGRIASLLSERGYQLRIEGHTDNVPIHNSQFDSNWELSTTRATEVVRQLIANYQFAPELLSAAGYAEYHPIATNDTPEGRAINRRIDVVVVRQQRVSR
jgi:chemotaxis protein MotB